MSTVDATIPEAGSGPPGLPGWLDLTLVSRRPARLPKPTHAAALGLPVPAVAPVPHTAGGTPPAASVVVVTYNNLAFSKLCLTSLLANTDAARYELIVIDNASTDGTPDYLGAVATAHPHVRVILNAVNRGFAPANNQGLAVAAGAVLVLLNNDTVVPPGWLDRLCRHLVDPSVGLVGPVTNRIGNEAEVDTQYRTYAGLLRAAADRAAAHAGRRFDISRPAMFCLAMRRDAHVAIGPLDEQFEIGLFEDDDYAMRARAAGYGAACAEDVLVHHFGEASFGTLFGTGGHAEVFRANRRRYEAKWGTAWQPPGRRPDPQYARMTTAIRDAARRAIPHGARVLVAAKGDDALLGFVGPGAAHFPQGEDGHYAGHHPPDSTAATEQLEAGRRGGAEFLLLPRTSFWWLDHYGGFAQHLECHYSAAHRDADCLVLDLRSDLARSEAGSGTAPGSHSADGSATRCREGHDD